MSLTPPAKRGKRGKLDHPTIYSHPFHPKTWSTQRDVPEISEISAIWIFFEIVGSSSIFWRNKFWLNTHTSKSHGSHHLPASEKTWQTQENPSLTYEDMVNYSNRFSMEHPHKQWRFEWENHRTKLIFQPARFDDTGVELIPTMTNMTINGWIWPTSPNCQFIGYFLVNVYSLLRKMD